MNKKDTNSTQDNKTPSVNDYRFSSFSMMLGHMKSLDLAEIAPATEEKGIK